MSHIDGNNQISQMSLYITADENTSGKVEVADNSFPAIPFNITARQITIVTIPKSAFLKDQGKFLKGLHITAEKKIAVYAHIYASSVSGATLLLPVAVLGKSYYSINYKQEANVSNAYSSFMIVATEDNTTVEITPSQLLLDGKAAGQTFSIPLKKGEVYQGLSDNDLTNTKIRSVSTAGECKKIAVFSGSTKIGIGCQDNNFTSDNLFQQVYPTTAWGKNYLTVPLKGRNYDIYRVIVSDINTVLKVNGTIIDKSIFALNNFYEFTSASTAIITANKPIQVAQYGVTQGKSLNGGCVDDNSDLGDPEMIFLNPLEQTLDHVTLYSTGRYNIVKHYINVVIKTSAVPSFKVDDEDKSVLFKLVQGNAAYSYAQLNVTAGRHTIRADAGFNATAYGFGNHESYGYAAGASLKNLNQYLALENPANNKTQDNGCFGVAYNVQLTLPYSTPSIVWDFHDGTTPQTVHAPSFSTANKDGKTIYIYKYPTNISFLKGDHNISATVVSPTVDECGSNEVAVDFDFNIADYPEARFSNEGACLNNSVQFTDKSDFKGSVAQHWLWDFGDGETSDKQNPTHIYTTAGDYLVTLSVTNENGCGAVPTVQTIHIYTLPTAKFIVSNPTCVGADITFTDQSVPGGDAIKKWLWNFGDGTAVVTRNTKQPFTHAFATTGPHTVKLTIESEYGCPASFEKIITIIAAPGVDFTMPSVCVDDEESEYVFKSRIAAATTAGLTFHWDFGDTHLSPGQSNTSADVNAIHKYHVTGIYTVSLTVTAPSGCAIIKTKQFTVNGNNPKADFTINENSLCSGNGIIINDKSTVDFGNITQIKIYYDFVNRPNESESFTGTQIRADKKYFHDYGTLTSDQTFTIKVEAYSGGVCGNTSDLQTVAVHANPVVKVEKIGTLCLGEPPVQIKVDANGFTGTGTFTGAGINANGIFNPTLAGPGIHTITYNFKTVNGCDFSDTQDITVAPNPVVNAGADLIQLEGESIVLPASAAGSNLTYKWVPAMGLDHDDIRNPKVSATDDTNYKLTVTSDAGCTATDEIFVKVLKKPVVVNTFTPNGDGINDIWTIKNIETYPGNTVDIYNRYGERVYSSVGYAIPWDGKYRGAIVPAGTYYYIINPKNGRKVISGSVTVIK
jgi:gliding motility-associated-like protein